MPALLLLALLVLVSAAVRVVGAPALSTLRLAALVRPVANSEADGTLMAQVLVAAALASNLTLAYFAISMLETAAKFLCGVVVVVGSPRRLRRAPKLLLRRWLLLLARLLLMCRRRRLIRCSRATGNRCVAFDARQEVRELPSGPLEFAFPKLPIFDSSLPHRVPRFVGSERGGGA